MSIILRYFKLVSDLLADNQYLNEVRECSRQLRVENLIFGVFYVNEDKGICYGIDIYYLPFF